MYFADSEIVDIKVNKTLFKDCIVKSFSRTKEDGLPDKFDITFSCCNEILNDYKIDQIELVWERVGEDLIKLIDFKNIPTLNDIIRMDKTRRIYGEYILGNHLYKHIDTLIINYNRENDFYNKGDFFTQEQFDMFINIVKSIKNRMLIIKDNVLFKRQFITKI